MKNLTMMMAFTGSLILATASMAHEGHEHAKQLDQASALQTAESKVESLISEGEVASKWASQAAVGAQLARINGIQNWIVTYIDESSRERLELVFSMTGDYVSKTVIPVNDTAAN